MTMKREVKIQKAKVKKRVSTQNYPSLQHAPPLILALTLMFRLTMSAQEDGWHCARKKDAIFSIFDTRIM